MARMKGRTRVMLSTIGSAHRVHSALSAADDGYDEADNPSYDDTTTGYCGSSSDLKVHYIIDEASTVPPFEIAALGVIGDIRTLTVVGDPHQVKQMYKTITQLSSSHLISSHLISSHLFSALLFSTLLTTTQQQLSPFMSVGSQKPNSQPRKDPMSIFDVDKVQRRFLKLQVRSSTNIPQPTYLNQQHTPTNNTSQPTYPNQHTPTNNIPQQSQYSTAFRV